VKFCQNTTISSMYFAEIVTQSLYIYEPYYICVKTAEQVCRPSSIKPPHFWAELFCTNVWSHGSWTERQAHQI